MAPLKAPRCSVHTSLLRRNTKFHTNSRYQRGQELPITRGEEGGVDRSLEHGRVCDEGTAIKTAWRAGAGAVAQQVRALTALLKVLSSIPSDHMVLSSGRQAYMEAECRIHNK